MTSSESKDLWDKEALAALYRGGWTHVRTSGSHVHVRRPNRGGLVTIPQHPGRILIPPFLKSIVKQADLTGDEFKGLL